MKKIKIKPQSKSDIRFEKRDVFSEKYDYEVSNYAMCVVCAYFQFNNTKENKEWLGKNGCGSCRLIKSMGAYDGVMSTAVCNKFLSHKGTDLNQKHVKNLPDFVKLIKDKKGNTSVVLTKGITA